jgi:transposase
MTQIRIVENFDTSFTLNPEAKAALFELLRGEVFLTQLATQLATQLEGKTAEFTELLFQPVPYSATTPKGMPPEFEPYFV